MRGADHDERNGDERGGRDRGHPWLWKPRSHPIELPDVLVDTGATLLCLPRSVVARLGLRLLREVNVATATGITTARLFYGAHVSVLGRDAVFDCLEVPDGAEPLLGYMLMERLGLEPDMLRHELRVLPEEHGATYLRA